MSGLDAAHFPLASMRSEFGHVGQAPQSCCTWMRVAHIGRVLGLGLLFVSLGCALILPLTAVFTVLGFSVLLCIISGIAICKLGTPPRLLHEVVVKEKEIKAKEFVQDPNEPISPFANLFTRYLECTEGEGFNQERISRVFNESRFIRTLEAYTQQFEKKVNYDENYGFIEKRDVEPNSKIFVRADLHGDLKALVENLKAVQKQGLLDANFRCKPNVHLVFLGDYMDRGDHSLNIAELLALLKLENPNQVHLIRGNHEYLTVNRIVTPTASVTNFIQKDEAKHKALLTNFYQTMPLTLYMGEAGEKQAAAKEYVQFTHAAFEPTTDPSAVVDSLSAYAVMDVPKQRVFSNRIKKLAKTNESAKAIVGLIASPTKKPGIHRRAKSQDKDEGTRMRQRRSSLGEEPKLDPAFDFTSYNWGDIGAKTHFGDMTRREWKLSVKDLKHYMNVNGTINKVKFIFRGHQHEFRHITDRDEIVGTTLPVAMDMPYYRKKFDQCDRAYILTTAPAVPEWTKVALLRPPGSSKTIFVGSDKVKITSDVV